MKDLKKDILSSLTPKAILMPLTKEAAESMVKTSCQKDVLPITNFPFKIGRESRLGENEKGLFLKFRLKKTDSKPNNDIYLIDNSKHLQISKEHFQIEKTNNFFLLKDRGSTMGTTINGITYGGKQEEFEQVLNDGDIIRIGSKDSEYKFQFITLDI